MGGLVAPDAPLVGFMHPQLDVWPVVTFPFSDTSYSPSRWIRSPVDALPGATGDRQIDILQLIG